MTPFGAPIPGETPIDDISGLTIKGSRRARNSTPLRRRTSRRLPPSTDHPSDAPSAKFHVRLEPKASQADGRRRVGLGGRSARTRHEHRHGVLCHSGKPTPAPSGLGKLVWLRMDFVEQATPPSSPRRENPSFVNGNGRWSRMLANIWLKHHRQPLTIVARKNHRDQQRDPGAYIAAIIKATPATTMTSLRCTGSSPKRRE